MPPEGTSIRYRNQKNMTSPSITIYADFECFQEECNVKKGNATTYTSAHIPSIYGFVVKSDYEETYKSFYESHTFDRDVAKDFVKRLIEV